VVRLSLNCDDDDRMPLIAHAYTSLCDVMIVARDGRPTVDNYQVGCGRIVVASSDAFVYCGRTREMVVSGVWALVWYDIHAAPRDTGHTPHILFTPSTLYRSIQHQTAVERLCFYLLT